MTKENQGDQIAPEIVERAKSMGWIPKEEFKGDESRWRPADEYVERAETMMPILKSQLGKYETTINSQKAELDTLKASLNSQKETTEKLVKMSSKISEEAYQRARRDITSKQAQAVADGDVKTWQELEDKKEALEKPEAVTMPEAQPENQNPVFNNWHMTNDWYAKDNDLTIYADGYANTIKQAEPNLPYDQVLAKVEAKVKEVFPHKFSNPNRQNASVVNDNANLTAIDTTLAGGKKSYNDLPAAAKEQCDAFIADGLIKDRDQYVKDFFDDNNKYGGM